jgi:hypothetical protein
MGSRRYRGRGGRHLTVGRNARAPCARITHADLAMDPRRARAGPLPRFDLRERDSAAASCGQRLIEISQDDFTQVFDSSVPGGAEGLLPHRTVRSAKQSEPRCSVDA